MTRRQYNKVVNNYANNLLGFSIKSLHDKSLAEDVVQDAFMKLWENRKKVEFEKSKAWLFVTARNMIINMVTKRARTKLTGEIEEISQVEEDNSFELKNLIDNALLQLSEIQRSIILFRDLEGFNYKEIGQLLNISEAKVKVYLFRGRQKVKSIIKAENINS